MELRDLASVSGKGGLFKIVKPTRTGVILESLDEKKSKLVATTHHRVSSLHEISIYTLNEEGSVPLEQILKTIFKEFGDDPGIDGQSSNEELKSFLRHVLPEYDMDRVYVSDIKRLLNWYSIILREVPEVLTAPEQPDEDTKEAES